MNINTYSEDLIDATSLSPAADAGGRTGTYVKVANGLVAYVIYHINQGNAATIALSPQQATTVAGGSAKAISTSTLIWANLDMATSSNQVVQTTGATFTTDAGVKVKLVVFKIQLSQMDYANGFVTLAAQTGASNAANITSARIVIVPRFSGSAASAINAMVD